MRNVCKLVITKMRFDDFCRELFVRFNYVKPKEWLISGFLAEKIIDHKNAVSFKKICVFIVSMIFIFFNRIKSHHYKDEVIRYGNIKLNFLCKKVAVNS